MNSARAGIPPRGGCCRKNNPYGRQTAVPTISYPRLTRLISASSFSLAYIPYQPLVSPSPSASVAIRGPFDYTMFICFLYEHEQNHMNEVWPGGSCRARRNRVQPVPSVTAIKAGCRYFIDYPGRYLGNSGRPVFNHGHLFRTTLSVIPLVTHIDVENPYAFPP